MPNTRVLMPRQPTRELFVRAQMAHGLSQGELGDALGVSRRTISRWFSRGPTFGVAELRTLARLVFENDPELANEIAWTASETLESLGLVAPAPPPEPPPPAAPAIVAAPAPPPAPPPPPPLPTGVVVDAVVCTAAEALGVVPSPALRRALAQAFGRARQLRLEVAEVEAALIEAAPSA